MSLSIVSHSLFHLSINTVAYVIAYVLMVDGVWPIAVWSSLSGRHCLVAGGVLGVILT